MSRRVADDSIDAVGAALCNAPWALARSCCARFEWTTGKRWVCMRAVTATSHAAAGPFAPRK